MARGGRRSSRAPSSDDEDDATDAPRTPDSNANDVSLKYRIGSTGKEARARAKLLRNASRRKREARSARRANERSPSLSSESSPELAGSTTVEALGKGKESAAEYRKLRAVLERVSLAENFESGDELYVECGDDARVVEASTFVSRVRMNEARLDEVERAYGASGTVWPTKAAARRMPSACSDRDRDEPRDDALDLLPAEVWERVFASVSLRTAVRMAATCKSLWVLSQRKFIVNRRYESMFGRALASEDERAERTMMVSYLSSERWLEDAHLGETVFPKPVHFSVGPSFVRGLLADETTVTSFDREKVKIWYHGADIRGDDDAGGRLASLFVEKKSSATRGLTALAINQTSIVAGDDGGRLRIWHSDTLEYVQRRAHAIPNDNAVSALCGIPATSLVVCASRQSSSLEIWETEDVTSVTSLPLVEGTDEQRRGVTCMSMFGGNSYGCHRSHIGATSRMWAGTTSQKVVGVDLNHANIVDTLSLPESCGPDAEISAIAVNGPLVSTTVKGFGAVIWDRRGMPQEQIVARFDSPFASSVCESEQSSCIDLEDFALWTSNPGDPGVCMFDIRKTFGPPRRQDRWVVGSPERYSPACVLRPRMRTRGFSEEVNVGCFARVPGEPGAVILAPDASCSDARCSIFSKRNDLPTAQEIEELEVADVDDGWRSRRARKQGKPPQPKSRGRYPKRQ